MILHDLAALGVDGEFAQFAGGQQGFDDVTGCAACAVEVGFSALLPGCCCWAVMMACFREICRDGVEVMRGPWALSRMTSPVMGSMRTLKTWLLVVTTRTS